jgi:hypothetical protein
MLNIVKSTEFVSLPSKTCGQDTVVSKDLAALVLRNVGILPHHTTRRKTCNEYSVFLTLNQLLTKRVNLRVAYLNCPL